MNPTQKATVELSARDWAVIVGALNAQGVKNAGNEDHRLAEIYFSLSQGVEELVDAQIELITK